MTVLMNKAVLYSGFPEKYRVAFFSMSRSSSRRLLASTPVARCLLITLMIFCFRRALACRALASLSFFSGEEVLGRPTFFGVAVFAIFCVALVLRMSRDIVCCLWGAAMG